MQNTSEDGMVKDTHAFIIRIWYEAVNNDGEVSNWRGSIDHVGANRRLYFNDIESIRRFIQEQTGIKLIQPGFSWRSFFSRFSHERD